MMLQPSLIGAVATTTAFIAFSVLAWYEETIECRTDGDCLDAACVANVCDCPDDAAQYWRCDPNGRPTVVTWESVCALVFLFAALGFYGFSCLKRKRPPTIPKRKTNTTPDPYAVAFIVSIVVLFVFVLATCARALSVPDSSTDEASLGLAVSTLVVFVLCCVAFVLIGS